MENGQPLFARTLLTLTMVPLVGISYVGLALQPAMAQGVLEEIVVTARKREERLVDIPLSVQAFTADELTAAGIASLADLSLYAPGFDYRDQSSGQFAGRYLPSIRFRGLTTQSALPSNQIGSLFVDGVFVLGGAQSIGLEDVERVEVIKGPQAAYFGRSTFGGAINYITADPGDEFSGQISAEASSPYDSYRMTASVEGPLLPGRLSGRLTVSSWQNGSYATATDGGGLGEETTDSFHGSLLFTPSDALRIKVRASYIEDEDGQPATTTIQFFNKSNCPAGTPTTVLDASGASRNVTLQGDYWCGALPEDVRVTANTTFTTFPAVGGFPEVDIRELFVGNSLGIPEIDEAPALDHFGLIRQTIRLAASFDYDLSDAITLSGNIAYNDQDVRQIADRDFTDAESVYMGPPNFFEDTSAELRAVFNSEGRLRGLVGVNYYEQDIRAAFTNAVEATNELSLDTLPMPFSLRVVGAQNSGNNDDKIETLGLFGAVEYDILKNLTVTLEGRWQSDEVTTFGGQFLTPSDPLALSSDEFLPRVILTYRPIEDTTVYVSYAEGTLPGQFNRNFLTLTPAERAAVQQAVPNLSESVPSETLKSYEIGLKQVLLDDRLNYGLALYTMDWENMKSAVSYLIPGRTGLQGGFVSGGSEVTGAEFQANWLPSENWELSATATFSDSEYMDFVVSGVNQLFGLSNLEGYRVDGNVLPRYPEWSGSLSATYHRTVTGDWDMYARSDLLYTGKAYADESNINWIDGFSLLNLRVGFERDDLRLELFADNATDEEGWLTGATGLDLGVVPVLFSNLFVRRGATVTAIRGREVGVRATLRF